MKKQILKGLTITYNISEEEKVNTISEFIQKHQFVFGDFDGENNNTTIDVNDFSNLVNRIVAMNVAEIAGREDLKSDYESEDFFPAIYLAYLTLKNKQRNNTILQLPSNMTVEQVLFTLSIKYYNYDAEKISQALLSSDSNEYTTMINRLKDEQRMNIYNYFLKNALGLLEEYDTSVLDHLESIIRKLTQKNTEYIKSLSTYNSKLDSLKKLSKEEFDKLFIDFLSYINAPQKWFELYNEARQNNLITFEYSKEMDNGACYFDETDNKWKIKLISDGTIRTFITFVHEFIHYVENTQNDKTPFSLLEFPSIYYENIAAEFLKNNGYEDEIIAEVIAKRLDNNCDLFSYQFLQLKDILSFKKNGPISLEPRIEFYENWIRSTNEFKTNMAEIFKNQGLEVPDMFLSLEERDPAEIANSEIDEKIDVLVKSGLLILNGYQYLVGSLLAFEILENTDRKHSNEMMIDVTNQLDNHSMASIMQLFGINLSSEPESRILK